QDPGPPATLSCLGTLRGRAAECRVLLGACGLLLVL
ncbi:hypothetical protein AK812_SmicGene46911, partial [Symbiodinium microadriaticum]